MARRLAPLLAVVSAGVALASACTTDHGALDKRDWGSGGTLADSGGGGGSEAGAGGAQDAGADAPVEPSGGYRFRLLNGMVDAERVQVCFRVKLETGSDVWLGAPRPAGGLPYGSALDLSELPWQPASQGFETFVFAGQLEQLANLDCQRALDLAQGSGVDAGAGAGGTAAGGSGGAGGEGGSAAGAGAGGAGPGGSPGSGGAAGTSADAGALDASAGSAGSAGAGGASLDAGAGEDSSTGGDSSVDGGVTPPALRAARLAMLPPGSLRDDRSYLMLLSGCMGGPSFSDASAETICGPGYSDATPTLTNSVVELSRITQALSVGVQFLNGSRAAGEADLLSVPGEQANGSPITIASRIQFGRIAPRPPNLDYPASSYGAPLSEVELQVFAYGATTPGATANWQSALSVPGLENARNYTVVVLGPSPGFVQQGWWQPSRIVALPNDP
ncbi:MAG: hypothetical protein KC766_25025 [Myxococcales bacterium]|nr:hypothetical protein [Myxococcales bacterium]